MGLLRDLNGRVACPGRLFVPTVLFKNRYTMKKFAAVALLTLGAVLVGLLESYSSFYASAFKEVIVFTLIIPVLVWRSLTSHHVEEEEE